MKENLKISQNKIEKVVFQCFNHINDQNATTRLKNSALLLQHLLKNDDSNEYQTNYALKRLIRGVGSSTAASRSGFYTTLVGFLKLVDKIKVSEIFDIVQKELQIGSSTDADKIDSHANTGRILVCGAIIESGKVLNISDDDLKSVIEMLVKSSKVKKFHSSLAFMFLVNLMQVLSAPKFKLVMLPMMREELHKPWPKQKLETLYFLLIAEIVHPKIVQKLFANIFGASGQLFREDSFSHFSTILLNEKAVVNVNHPIYEQLSSILATSDKLIKFWTNYVDPRLENTNKSQEICTIKMLTVIFSKTSFQPNVTYKLLSGNIMERLVTSFQHKNQKNAVVIEFYRDLFTAISSYLKRIEVKSENGILKFAKQLILKPGYLMFDRLTSSDILATTISLLSLSEVKELVELMKKIVTGQQGKNDGENAWLNSEKLFALQTINKLSNLPVARGEIEWRTQQILFSLNLAIFKTNDGHNFVKDSGDDVVESVPIANLKQIFYQSLQTKFKSLEDESRILLQLVEHCNAVMKQKHGSKRMKVTLSADGARVFNELCEEVITPKNKKNAKLDLVFQILLLHMGLQLFNDEKLAINAIEELKMCMSRVSTKKRNSTESEPEWIEVVVDLFLHLLSQSSSLLRQIIAKVFPQLCPFLTMNAIHQILSLLDPLVENPLNGENDPPTDDENESDEESDGDDDDDDANDDEDENEVDDDDSIMGEEGTVSDQLRLAVREALGGAAPESDVDSLDLDDMDEGDAKKLDDALSAAFKLYSENRKRNKKTRREKIVETTVIHFRLRVFDLLEIYIKSEPKMSYLLEILIAAFDLLNYCVKDTGGPILSRVKGLLNKITAIKSVNDHDDVTEANLVEIFKNLIEKKFNSFAIAERNLYLSKSAIFIIHCSETIAKSQNGKTTSTPAMTNIFGEYLKEFLRNRNPALAQNIFMSIFEQTWPGIWDLSRILIENGVHSSVISIRRVQVVQLLASLFKNIRFLQLDLPTTQRYFKLIESKIQQFVTDNVSISQKMFAEILNLLIEIKKCHQKLSIECQIDWTELNSNKIENIRNDIILESSALNIYRKYCQMMSMKFVANKTKEAPQLNGVAHQNGNDVEMNGSTDNSDSEKEDQIPESNGKRKNPQQENTNKSKKQKKEARAKISAEGLNGGLSFANLSDTEELIETTKPTEIPLKKQKKKLKH